MEPIALSPQEAKRPEPLMTLPEVAGLMKASVRTVRRLIDGGELGYTRAGHGLRVPVSEYEDWKRRNTVRAGKQPA